MKRFKPSRRRQIRPLLVFCLITGPYDAHVIAIRTPKKERLKNKRTFMAMPRSSRNMASSSPFEHVISVFEGSKKKTRPGNRRRQIPDRSLSGEDVMTLMQEQRGGLETMG
ncbi:uncharacterized protein EI90DRAFT_3061439, partial [Cantharellus anzutake]|uniref:uncharacterized protein n=1 Tax=Cantharellus anzutake TaxID=1750568 RepID=UPI00190580B7